MWLRWFAGRNEVLMFSLAGVPPFLGFFGKLYVWRAALDGGMIWLVVASAVASAIGAFYYLRIVFLMYFGADKSEALDRNRSGVLSGFLVASAVIMVIGIVNMFGVEGAAALAAQALVE